MLFFFLLKAGIGLLGKDIAIFLALEQTLMDFHVTSASNRQYIIDVKAGSHIMSNKRELFQAAASTYSNQLSEKTAQRTRLVYAKARCRFAELELLR